MRSLVNTTKPANQYYCILEKSMRRLSRPISKVFMLLILTASVGVEVVSYKTLIAATGAYDVAVKAGSKNVFVYNACVAGYTVFSCDGLVPIEITCRKPIETAFVRPFSLYIESTSAPRHKNSQFIQ